MKTKQTVIAMLLVAALVTALAESVSAYRVSDDGHVWGQGDSIPAAAEDAIGTKVHVGFRAGDLDRLTYRGSVATQWYTYFKFANDRTGQIEDHPAYCIQPGKPGVPKAGIDADGLETVDYFIENKVGDKYCYFILQSGWPHNSKASLQALANLSRIPTDEEAYYL